jgi:hypothetical protein
MRKIVKQKNSFDLFGFFSFSEHVVNVYCCVTRYSNHTIFGKQQTGKYNNTLERDERKREKTRTMAMFVV